MVNTAQIISMVQTNINDLALERIQLAEYVDHLNFIAMDVAEQVEIYINRFVNTPVPLATSITNPVFFVNIPYQDGSPKDLSLFKIIRVVRSNGNSWNECREYSSQAVSRTISGNASFDLNNTQLGLNDYATMFGSPTNGMDHSTTLYFGKNFDENEMVVIDFISGRPWADAFSTDPSALSRWMPNNGNAQTIPDFLRNSFEQGLLYRVCESLYYKGDDSYRDKADRAKLRYDAYLRQAVGYSKMFKDYHHNLQMQPLNWLAEEYD